MISDEEAYFPRWIKSVSQFGISYNTKKSPVAFVDDRFLRCADEDSILEYLSKGLFLDGDGAYIKNEAKVMLIANKPKEKSEFSAILTLINTGADTVSGARLYIPEKFAKVNSLSFLDTDGEWKEAEFEKSGEDIIVKMPLEFQEPVYLMIK